MTDKEEKVNAVPIRELRKINIPVDNVAKS